MSEGVKLLSKYTISVRYICEQLAGASLSPAFAEIPKIIATAAPKIFDFDFPIYDEAYRTPLTEHILLHFYTREICADSYGEWKLRLMQTLRKIMPKYNELYKSVQFKYDPMMDVDYTTQTDSDSSLTTRRGTSAESSRTDKTKSTSSGTNKVDGSSTNSQDSLFSDTPQGKLDNVREGAYLTSATINSGANSDSSVSENSQTANADSTRTATDSAEEQGEEQGTRSLTSRVFGKSSFRSYGRLLQEFRENILNVDAELFRELDSCFMMVY